MHWINGFVGRWDGFDRTMLGVEEAVIAPLQQSFGLLLVDNEPSPIEDDLEPRLEGLGQMLSRSHGDVAFVATEYFGGTGGQAAAAWRRGEVLMRYSDARGGVINQALSLIGVQRGTGYDLYADLGLGRYRSHEDWTAFARFGRAKWERQ